MPSASSETIEEVSAFLPEVTDDAAIDYLQARGYKLDRSWEWSKPGIVGYDDMTREEFACLKYLCHEWDFGGLKNV